MPDPAARPAERSKRRGWTPALVDQHAALFELAAPFTVHDVCRTLGQKKPNAQRILNALVDLGAMRREEDDHPSLPWLHWPLPMPDNAEASEGRRRGLELNRLEAVEVDVQNGDLTAVGVDAVARPAEVVEKRLAVRQPGQPVDERAGSE